MVNLAVAAMLVLLSLPAFARQRSREGTRWIFGLLVASLILKLVGALLRYFVAFELYGGLADAALYDARGALLAELIRMWRWSDAIALVSSAGVGSGTQFIQFVTGVVYAASGTDLLRAFLIFSWLGFWGLYFSYRAFVVAFGSEGARMYRPLVLFLPSLLFWPSSVGKEAWMILALGVAAYGVAIAAHGRPQAGLLILVGASLAAAAVRVHVAAIFAGAFAVGVALSTLSARLTNIRSGGRAFLIAAGVALGLLLAVQAGTLLREQYVDEPNLDIESALAETQERTTGGGSTFSAPVITSPLALPAGALTVLYRPLAFEVSSVITLMASVEGTFLLALTFRRRRSMWKAIRSVTSNMYVAVAGVYVLLFIVAFSSFSNFGLLVRQRVQVMPLFLVLISIPPPFISAGTRPIPR